MRSAARQESVLSFEGSPPSSQKYVTSDVHNAGRTTNAASIIGEIGVHICCQLTHSPHNLCVDLLVLGKIYYKKTAKNIR